MNRFFVTLRKYSREAALYLLYATGAFCFIYYVGNFGGGFLSVMGNLFLMFAEIALWISVPILLSMGKKATAKSALRPVFTFWLLYTVFTYLDECRGIAPAFSTGVTIAMGVFELLLACALLVIAVLTVLASLRKEQKMKKVALLIFTACLIVYLVVFALRVAVYAEIGAGWSDYFGVIYQFLTLPFGMYFLAQNSEFTLDDMHLFEEKAATSKQDAPADEETPADTSTEEEK